jgi:hypothetical protein
VSSPVVSRQRLLTVEILQLHALRYYLHSVACRILFTDRLTQSQSQIHVTTDDQSASLSWNKAPIWGVRPDFHYCQTIAGLLIWGALSDERSGLSLTNYTHNVSPLCRLEMDRTENTAFIVGEARLPRGVLGTSYMSVNMTKQLLLHKVGARPPSDALRGNPSQYFLP